MKKLKENWVILLIMVVALTMYFYWTTYKPMEIRKGCYKIAELMGTEYQHYYDICILRNGLEK